MGHSMTDQPVVNMHHILNFVENLFIIIWVKNSVSELFLIMTILTPSHL